MDSEAGTDQLLAAEALEELEARGDRPSRGRVATGALLMLVGLAAGTSGTLLLADSTPSSLGGLGDPRAVLGRASAAQLEERNLRRTSKADKAPVLDLNNASKAVPIIKLNTTKCHWILMRQHDYPERSDTEAMDFSHYHNRVDEVKRFAEQHDYVGFAIHDNKTYMKGGDNAPRSWKDLLWMGNTFKVDFWMCERPEVWKQTQERVDKAMALVEGYVAKRTATVKDDEWVTVRGLPYHEGGPMGFDNGHDVKNVHDFKVLCAAHPDCVGFAHSNLTHEFFAKTKWSGFDSKTAEYHHQQGDHHWRWTYIASRGDDPQVNAENKTHLVHRGFTQKVHSVATSNRTSSKVASKPKLDASHVLATRRSLSKDDVP